MRLVLLVIALGGCAQLAAIEETSKAAPDAAVDAAPRPDAPIDALACTGGDARVVDPTTGTCYVYFTAPLPRNAARGVCAGLGAGTYLASVHSAAENTIIANLVGSGSVFLGGNDNETEGTFVWDDGTPFTQPMWNTGEPNNGLGMLDEDCVVFHGTLGSLWDDRPCSTVVGSGVPGEYGFVCKR